MTKALIALVLIVGGIGVYGYFDNAASGQGAAPSRTDTGRPAQPGDGKNAVWYGRYTLCSDQSPDISLSCTGTITRARQVPRGAPQPYPPQLRPSRDGRFSGHQLDHHCRDLAVRLGRSGEQSGPLCTQEEAENQARQNPGRHLEVDQGTPNAQGLILAVDNRWFRPDGHRVDPTTGWRFSNHPAGRQSQYGQLHATREWSAYGLYLACADRMTRLNKPFDKNNPPCTQAEALQEIQRNPSRYQNHKTRWDKNKEKLNYLEEDWREK